VFVHRVADMDDAAATCAGYGGSGAAAIARPAWLWFGVTIATKLIRSQSKRAAFAVFEGAFVWHTDRHARSAFRAGSLLNAPKLPASDAAMRWTLPMNAPSSPRHTLTLPVFIALSQYLSGVSHPCHEVGARMGRTQWVGD
jgi:hypothetical protein